MNGHPTPDGDSLVNQRIKCCLFGVPPLGGSAVGGSSFKEERPPKGGTPNQPVQSFVGHAVQSCLGVIGKSFIGKSLALLTIGVALAFVTAASVLAQAPRLSDIAAYEGPDREKRLVEGAKREGELMLYSSIPVEDIAVLTAAFDKKYGVKVKVWRSDSEGFLQRIVNEARARRYEVDVVAGASSSVEPLQRERLLTVIKSPYLADLIPESIPAHREWASVYLNTFVQAFNTNLVKKETLPKSYAELLNPQFKGKLGIEAEDFDWFAQVVTGLGERDGP